MYAGEKGGESTVFSSPLGGGKKCHGLCGSLERGERDPQTGAALVELEPMGEKKGHQLIGTKSHLTNELQFEKTKKII